MRLVWGTSGYSQTYDEPFHIARGMRIWHTGTYPYVHHPPLAPLVFALLPTLAGVEYKDHGGKLNDGNGVLYGSGDYDRALLSARLGNLPFFVGACLAVWRWASYLLPPIFAVATVGVFTHCPPVLAHAGLATTDMAITCLLPWWLWFLKTWWESLNSNSESGSIRNDYIARSLAFGMATGLMLVAKFSVLVFAPLSGIVLLALGSANSRERVKRAHRIALGLSVCSLLAFLVVWASYFGSVGTIAQAGQRADRELRFPLVSDKVNRHLQGLVIPAPEYIAGVLSVAHQDHHGQAPYFLGKTNDGRGDWRFFPMLLTVKTPLPILLLALVGGATIFWRVENGGAGNGAGLPICLALCILLPAMGSNINLGVRHILPIYPWIAILAALGLQSIWSARLRPAETSGERPRFRWIARGVICGILVWLAAPVARCHPDYLSYFNLLAGEHPERITVDSDLDWGQDLTRLRAFLRSRKIERFYLAYHGTADARLHGLEGFTQLPQGKRVTGWIAISVFVLYSDPGYAWLCEVPHCPLPMSSIRVYYLRA